MEIENNDADQLCNESMYEIKRDGTNICWGKIVNIESLDLGTLTKRANCN